MKYKQGKQRVANDEVFPYPLKCWYDDENIYVKVLRIPEPEECKLSPYLMKGVRDGIYDINNYENNLRGASLYYGYRGNYFFKLRVCLEIEKSKNLKYSSHHQINRSHFHPGKGGQFYHTNINLDDFPRAVKNRTYTFPLNSYFNEQALYGEDRGYDSYPPFTRVRATLRFMRYGNDNIPERAILERTGIYSNIIKIEK